jgi:2-polyprenyl-3-methyl-5-hydroxy-6-metoxy-1,4-benzoquinol methylase
MILKECEIRPDELMQAQAERFAADVRRLLQRKDDFVDVSCPSCNSDSKHQTFQKYGMSYVTCSDCQTLYISPRPTPELLENYYATSENYAYWNKYIFPASENARREKIFRPRAERVAEICQRHNLRTDVLMEVGAGFGTFCEEVRRLGIFERVIAVEPTPDLSETCRKKGLEVIQKPIEQVRLNDGEIVDVIATFEVIEHLFSPRDFLRGCASVLGPGGLIIITCPNVKGFDVAVLQEASDTVDVEHLNYFHPESLSALLNESGFEVLEAMTPGKLDAELVRKKTLAGAFDLSRQPFLKEVLIDRWEEVGGPFQQFLADNLLSSHMWLVARKKADGVPISSGD